MARLFSLGLDNVPKRVSISSSVFLAAFAHEVGRTKAGQQHETAAQGSVGIEVVAVVVVGQQGIAVASEVAGAIVFFVEHIATVEQAAFLCVEAESHSEDDGEG